VVAEDSEVSEREEWGFIMDGLHFFFRRNENVLELDYGDSCTVL
jgi:hypothetical protein